MNNALTLLLHYRIIYKHSWVIRKQNYSTKVSQSGQFSVMTNTTPDLSHADRLSVIVRFVNSEGTIENKLLEISKALNKTGVEIANNILGALQKSELNPDNLMFLSYDFNSSMSRVFNSSVKFLKYFDAKNEK